MIMKFPFYSTLQYNPTFLIQSVSRKFPFTGIYTYAPLMLTTVQAEDSLSPAQNLKKIIYSTYSATIPVIWIRIREWFHNIGSPKPSQSTFTFPDYSTTETKSIFTRVDVFRSIQIVMSLIGLGISVRLMFYLIEQINPTLKEKRAARKRAEQIFKELGFTKLPSLTDYEVCIAVNLVDPHVLSTTWNSIGGLDLAIEEIKESVIGPMETLESVVVKSKLLRPPKGVLLFGPPGCGKTLLARAMARAAKANFINLQISTLVNMWYGETQKYVEATFSLAHKLQPTIIFIDELDSFLTTRSHLDNEATRMIKTQFMALWDGLLSEDDVRILIVGATNRPEDLDQAILRRLPYKIRVPLPNHTQRVHILKVILRGDPLARRLTDEDLETIASHTDNLSGSDLAELCREAAFISIRKSGISYKTSTAHLTPSHFIDALNKFLNYSIKSKLKEPLYPQPD